MAKDKEKELRDVMAEEESRGRRRPVKALTLERKRRLYRLARMLADRNCERSDYLKVLREDFGLKDESDEFQQLVKLWYEYRGGS